MVRFVFSVEDLARTRFAISPIWELVHGLQALREPAAAALHVPWLRSLSGRLRGLALEPAVALVVPRGYSPDFITPPPGGPLGRIEDDLAALRATPAAQVRDEMTLFRSQHARSGPIVEPWLAHPRRELGRLAAVFEGFWERALDPVWPRVHGFLDADIAYRARRLADAGPAALFGDLAREVTWEDDHLDVAVPLHEATIELGGRGLLLVPSAFSSIRPSVIDRPPWQPTVIYPARGLATLWEETVAADDGIARLLGPTRATLLADLGAPRSTTDIARRLEISPANASHHLGVLHDAGLVSRRREGRAVLYVRTQIGDALSAGTPTRDS